MIVIENRRARHDYEILETREAGIELTGSEVKSIRAGKASIKESFVSVDRDEEAWLFNMHIARYESADPRTAPDEKRSRRLLLHKKEIVKISERVKLERLAIVPLKLYFNKANRVKVQIALGRGKKLRDKREAIKERDIKIDLKRLAKKRL
ncbi:MAG: SsrA-binding protein SmpB [Helicobacteraceae bacterium]|nr:SsrA-binding protein SmpB [Helicobacteraceae bacterium]